MSSDKDWKYTDKDPTLYRRDQNGELYMKNPPKYDDTDTVTTTVDVVKEDYIAVEDHKHESDNDKLDRWKREYDGELSQDEHYRQGSTVCVAG